MSENKKEDDLILIIKILMKTVKYTQKQKIILNMWIFALIVNCIYVKSA